MKKLMVIRGALGVGKSTVAKIVAEKLNAIYLSLDKIIDENNLTTDNGIPLGNFLKSNQIIQDLLNEYNAETFVLDGCFYYMEQVEDLKKKFGSNVTFITLKSSLEKCIERDSKREKVYGKESAQFVFNMTEGVNVGYEIRSDNLSIEETVEKVLDYLQNTL